MGGPSVASRHPGAAPLRITGRVDYAVKSVLFLAQGGGSYLSAREIADHFNLSPKLVGGVLWRLAMAGILESRAGWHGGFRLAGPPETISLGAVIAAAGIDPSPGSEPGEPTGLNGDAHPAGGVSAQQVSTFWRALDRQIQDTLAAFSVADLVQTSVPADDGGPGAHRDPPPAPPSALRA
jgi:Rrf2 family protein